ncbi:MAG TPA: PhoH family protein [Flavobacteriales bacterium]|nr:PhoH family protein [Flavobacteriales bacterium]HRE98017.1 PhoH family protein [Flavobacteriales bacterium]HRJ35617.1 PhoH family protein [Flavobacteriales bacterium]HRJ39754.1 PhoH family protein [Flavobacteriales bacterium]
MMMAKRKNQVKIFVLDTSVILHDHNSINNFDDNFVAIPIVVLEELDNFKRGHDSKNFEAREFIRIMDKLSGNQSLQDWIPLEGNNKGKFKIVMTGKHGGTDANVVYGERKADHRILNAALSLMDEEKDKQVVLVSKDINLRLKAKALNILAEDYETGKISDLSNFNTGRIAIENVDPDEIRKIFTDGFTENTSILNGDKVNNQFYILKSDKSSTLAYYNPFVERVERVEKQFTYGIKPRNAEQTFALHAIMNDDVKLVTIQGVAGTGKTLLALAGAIEQRKKYNQIILARPIVPLSNRDIGYLPGDANEKINPYMEPLWDNLKFIKSQFSENEKRYKAIDEMVQEQKIVVTPLAFIRGRSFSNIFFIIDEAQNLTPHEVKTIITRAGENTKIIFTGDIFQIDTPYLDEQSNGLSYIIDRLKGSKLYAHVTLEKGERSELANLANDLL